MKKVFIYLVNVDTFFVSHRLNVAKKLLDSGSEVHIATEFTKYRNKLNKMGFITHKINFKRNSMNILSLLICFYQIFVLFYKVRPNLVHLISAKPIVFGGINSFLTNINNMVISITGLGSIFIANNFLSKILRKIFNLIYKFIFKFPNLKVIVQNKSDLRYLIKNSNLNKKKTEIIGGMGVDLKKFKPIKLNNKVPIILMVSRIIGDKGIYEFIDSAKSLKRKQFMGKFYLIGDTDYQNPSYIKKEEIKIWIKKKIINYYKYQTNIYKFLKKSTIVVLPSYREGFPKILMEAAACGKPIITTNVPGCRETIINGVTGILVKPKNSKNLAQAIYELSSNKKKLSLMSKNARKFAEKNFDTNYIVDKHLQIYKTLFNNISI